MNILSCYALNLYNTSEQDVCPKSLRDGLRYGHASRSALRRANALQHLNFFGLYNLAAHQLSKHETYVETWQCYVFFNVKLRFHISIQQRQIFFGRKNSHGNP